MSYGKGLRGVSIIGVGATPIGDIRQTPEIKDFTERELFAMASMNAMEDAGVTAKDLDAFFLGISGANYDAKIKSAAPQFGGWIGMRGKPSVFHDEGCASACFGLEMAVNAVASGRYDCVLSAAVNINTCVPKGNHLPFLRGEMSNDDLWNTVYSAADPAYEKAGYGGAGPLDAITINYCLKHGVSLEQMDDAFVTYILGKRAEALNNPLAAMATMSYEEEMEYMGYDDVRAYLKSEDFNPLVGTVIRSRYLGQTNVDASAAVIVCASDLVEKYTKNVPIEVAAITTSTTLGNPIPDLPISLNKEMYQRVYEQAGITDPGKEIDMMSIHDCPIATIVPCAEDAGYLPEGEGWKYMSDGELNHDGKKPINTSGGRTQTGHPRSPAFNIEVMECVLQMRGDAGERQIAGDPKTALLWSGGAAWNLGACILRKKEA